VQAYKKKKKRKMKRQYRGALFRDTNKIVERGRWGVRGALNPQIGKDEKQRDRRENVRAEERGKETNSQKEGDTLFLLIVVRI